MLLWNSRIVNLKNKHKAFPLSLILLLISIQPVSASTEVELRVYGCNNNNICEPGIGETNPTCSNDCNPCNNNNICEVLKGESIGSCPSDCQPAATPEPSAVSTQVSGSQSGSWFSGSMLVIGDVKIVSQKDGVNISWKTSVPTFGQIQWGTTPDYISGSIDKINVSNSHTTFLTNLLPDTFYYFKITSSLPGIRPVEYTGSFTTTVGVDFTSPANVSNLKISPEGNDTVMLTWQNPNDPDFAGVKVLQSPYFFAKNKDDGKLVYEGKGNYTRDINLNLSKIYYYTLFTYDTAGNYSSGSLIRYRQGTTTAEQVQLPATTTTLTLQDFDFIQNHLGLPSSKDMVTLYPFYPIDISIPKEKISDKVAFIILNIRDPFIDIDLASYKLSLAQDKKSYDVRMGVLGTTGKYPVTFEFIGGDNKKISEIKGTFDVRVVTRGPLSAATSYILILLGIIVYGTIRKFVKTRVKNSK